MGFIETSYGGKPNLSDVNIDSNLNLGLYGITTDGELDINDSDLIGVNQFICKDYLGAIKLEAANNEEWNLILNDVLSYNIYSKKFRVPSNVINGSSIYLKAFFTNTAPNDRNFGLYKYDSQTGTYTLVSNILIPKNTTTATEMTSNSISINAGDVLCFMATSANLTFLGSTGVKIMCNLSSVTGGYWEITD